MGAGSHARECEALHLVAELVAFHGEEPQRFATDLAWALSALAEVREALGRQGGRIAALAEAVSTVEDASSKGVAQAQRDLPLLTASLAHAYFDSGDRTKALALIERAENHERVALASGAEAPADGALVLAALARDRGTLSRTV